MGIFRIAVHTRDYILSMMRKGRIDAKKELSALEMGVKAASALAATGSLKGAPPDEVNENGLRSVQEFCQAGAVSQGRGAVLYSEDRIICMTPSLVAKSPLITVGLGDTATAAIFLHELYGIWGSFSNDGIKDRLDVAQKIQH
jgi:ADP-dependent phosphofructokinase/glucokinase